MENIINIGTFIQHLTYYIKIGIYINKGTKKSKILERCIKLYNKYKTIEACVEINEDDETFVRKCLKRLNLILKIDDDGNPIDIRKKESQLRMVYFEPHPSLINDDMESMLEYAKENNIYILTEIPLLFILRDSKYQDLLWQYTRSLFYISQLLISFVGTDADPESDIVITKHKIFDDAALKLETILVNISDIEEKIKLNQIMTLDKFLNSKLVKTGINEKNVSEARNEVKEIFQKKGLGNDNSMTKMIDLISDNLNGVDLSKGNIIKSMLGIAQDVAQEMRGDLEQNPEKFQNTLGAITEVFQEAMQENKDGNEIPADLKNMFNTVLSAVPSDGRQGTNNNASGNQPSGEEEIIKALEGIIETNSLDRNDFLTAIKSDTGEIDVDKLENYLTKLQ